MMIMKLHREISFAPNTKWNLSTTTTTTTKHSLFRVSCYCFGLLDLRHFSILEKWKHHICCCCCCCCHLVFSQAFFISFDSSDLKVEESAPNSFSSHCPKKTMKEKESIGKNSQHFEQQQNRHCKEQGKRVAKCENQKSVQQPTETRRFAWQKAEKWRGVGGGDRLNWLSKLVPRKVEIRDWAGGQWTSY